MGLVPALHLENDGDRLFHAERSIQTEEETMPYLLQMTDVTVRAYFPPIIPIEELIIQNGTGQATTFDFTGTASYEVRVNWTATPINKLRLGEVVVVTGKDNDQRTVLIPVPLKTVRIDDNKKTAWFSGPAREAVVEPTTPVQSG
jgi:hypothetical protein